MDDLIEDIRQRTGLPTETVVEVVTMVTEYVRAALPDDLVQQVADHLGTAATTATGAAETTRTAAARAGTSAAGAASAIIGAAAGAASSTVGMAQDAVSGVTGNDDE